MEDNKGKVRFVRIRGRIVPIKQKTGSSSEQKAKIADTVAKHASTVALSSYAAGFGIAAAGRNIKKKAITKMAHSAFEKHGDSEFAKKTISNAAKKMSKFSSAIGATQKLFWAGVAVSLGATGYAALQRRKKK